MTVEDKKAKIRSVVEELKARSVSHETFRPYHEKVRTALQTIDAQVESIEEQHKRAVAFLEELDEDEQVKKSLREQSFVPYRYYEAWMKVHELHSQFVTWSGVAQHMARVALEKYAEALSESRALDIERDAMKRFAEYQQRQETFHQKLVEDRLRVLEEAQRREIDWFKKEVVGVLVEKLPGREVRERLETPPPITIPRRETVENPPPKPTVLDEESSPSPVSKAKTKLGTLGFGSPPPSVSSLGFSDEEGDDE